MIIVFFRISLVPQDLIIEAENENELQEKTKRITVENLVWKTVRLNKEDLKKELKSRYIYTK